MKRWDDGASQKKPMATFLATTATPLASEPMTWIWIAQQTTRESDMQIPLPRSSWVFISFFTGRSSFLIDKGPFLTIGENWKKEQKFLNPISIFFLFDSQMYTGLFFLVHSEKHERNSSEQPRHPYYQPREYSSNVEAGRTEFNTRHDITLGKYLGIKYLTFSGYRRSLQWATEVVFGDTEKEFE